MNDETIPMLSRNALSELLQRPLMYTRLRWIVS